MTSSDLTTFGAVGLSLVRTVEEGRLSPSYLFEGPDAGLLEEAGREFAIAVLESGCEEPQRARVRDLVERDAHPDLYVRGKDKATVISVAALGVTLEQAHAAPIAGRHQVFVIQPAEAMEPEGVARYLNALEEPPPGTVFILLSTRPDRLPKAVLSRVRRIRLPPLSEEHIAERLVQDGEESARARTLARYAGGSLARARRMATAGVVEIVQDLFETARAEAQGVSAASERTVSALQSAGQAIAEAEGGDLSMRREAVRTLLADVLHGIGVDARDVAAGRPSAALGDAPVAVGLDLLEELGPLTASVPLNVTPAAVVLETLRRLRRRLR